jgi:hypothetical protein
VHTLLIYLDQDEVVLVTLQPEFTSRDMNGILRRLAYVERRLQSFPHLRASDIPAHVELLDIQPARADCRYLTVDDETLRHLRELEMRRAAEAALDGASAHQAIRDLKAAIAAIPPTVVAERDRMRRARETVPEAADPFAEWSSPASLALLQESHADIAARIHAAATVLARYAADPTGPEPEEPRANDHGPADEQADHAPTGMWRRFYDRPGAAKLP